MVKEVQQLSNVLKIWVVPISPSIFFTVYHLPSSSYSPKTAAGALGLTSRCGNIQETIFYCLYLLEQINLFQKPLSRFSLMSQCPKLDHIFIPKLSTGKKIGFPAWAQTEQNLPREWGHHPLQLERGRIDITTKLRWRQK